MIKLRILKGGNYGGIFMWALDKFLEWRRKAFLFRASRKLQDEEMQKQVYKSVE